MDIEQQWAETKKVHLKKGRPEQLANSPLEASCFERYYSKDDVVFEFGSGWSTVYYSTLVKEFYSVEHDGGWGNKVKEQLGIQENVSPMFVEDSNVTLYVIPPHEQKFDDKLDKEASKLVLNYSKDCPIKDIHPTLGTLDEVQVKDGITYWSGRGGVDWHSFVDYINSIERPGIKFDKVVVDGRCRVFCAFKALDYLKDDGLLFIHDFMNRPWNHTVLEYYEIIESADTLAVLRRK